MELVEESLLNLICLACVLGYWRPRVQSENFSCFDLELAGARELNVVDRSNSWVRGNRWRARRKKALNVSLHKNGCLRGGISRLFGDVRHAAFVLGRRLGACISELGLERMNGLLNSLASAKCTDLYHNLMVFIQ